MSPRCRHANYGGAVGVWRLMDMFDRHQIRATIGANGLAVEKWPETIHAFHEAGHEIASHGMTNDYYMTDLAPGSAARGGAQLLARRDRGLRRHPPRSEGPDRATLHTPETLWPSWRTRAIAGSATAFDDDVPPILAEVNGRKIAVIPKLNYANDWRGWSGGLGNATTFFRGVQDLVRLHLSGSRCAAVSARWT